MADPMTALLEAVDEVVDELAAGRKVQMAQRSKENKMMYHVGFEHGTMTGGMHTFSTLLAGKLAQKMAGG